MLGAIVNIAIAEEDWDGRGILKYQGYFLNVSEDALLAQQGGPNQFLQDFNLRLMQDFEKSAWTFTYHYQLNFTYSADENFATGIKTDYRRLANLSYKMIDQADKRVEQRLDRLYAHYRGEKFSFKIGRQAVTWGRAFVFHVMDLFNPFSPLVLDQEYKTGDDMLTGEFLVNNNSDVQALLVPRRNSHGELGEESSSAAVKYRVFWNRLDLDFMLSRHRSNSVAAISLSHPLGDSLWRLDVVAQESDVAERSYALVSNMDYSWVSWQRNFYGYIEVYHNNSKRSEISGISITSQNYFAAGVQIEMHPLLNINPLLLSNLDDKSGLLMASVNYNMSQNFSINAIAYTAFGDKQSEYAGDTTPGNAFSLLLKYYF